MRALILVGAILLAGCQEMYSYELASIAKSCGGYENIHRAWLDMGTVKAVCLDGKRVTSGDK